MEVGIIAVQDGGYELVGNSDQLDRVTGTTFQFKRLGPDQWVVLSSVNFDGEGFGGNRNTNRGYSNKCRLTLNQTEAELLLKKPCRLLWLRENLWGLKQEDYFRLQEAPTIFWSKWESEWKKKRKKAADSVNEAAVEAIACVMLQNAWRTKEAERENKTNSLFPLFCREEEAVLVAALEKLPMQVRLELSAALPMDINTGEINTCVNFVPFFPEIGKYNTSGLSGVRFEVSEDGIPAAMVEKHLPWGKRMYDLLRTLEETEYRSIYRDLCGESENVVENLEGFLKYNDYSEKKQIRKNESSRKSLEQIAELDKKIEALKAQNKGLRRAIEKTEKMKADSGEEQLAQEQPDSTESKQTGTEPAAETANTTIERRKRGAKRLRKKDRSCLSLSWLRAVGRLILYVVCVLCLVLSTLLVRAVKVEGALALDVTLFQIMAVSMAIALVIGLLIGIVVGICLNEVWHRGAERKRESKESEEKI